MKYTYSHSDLLLNSIYGYEYYSTIDDKKEKFSISIFFECSGNFLSGDSLMTVNLNKKELFTYKLSSLELTYIQNAKNTLISDRPNVFDSLRKKFLIELESLKKISSSSLDQRFILMAMLINHLSSESDNGVKGKDMITEDIFYTCFDQLVENIKKANYDLQIHIKILKDFLDQYRKSKELGLEKDQKVENNHNEVTKTQNKKGMSKVERLEKIILDQGGSFQKLKSGYIVNGKRFSNLDSILRQHKIKLVK